MHKDQLAFVTFTPFTEFLITASIDGQVSFWKKVASGDLEFVKEFKAHNGEIRSVSVSWDGRNFASAGADGSIKIWDVVTFDLVAVVSVEKSPGVVCWCHRRGASVPLLAVGNVVDGEIAVFDGRGESQEPLHIVKGLHRRPVVAMGFNAEHDCIISADEGGMVEYWRPSGNYEKPDNVFAMKSSTNLFEFKKVYLLWRKSFVDVFLQNLGKIRTDVDHDISGW